MSIFIMINSKSFNDIYMIRPLVKSANEKIDFLISQTNPMLSGYSK